MTPVSPTTFKTAPAVLDTRDTASFREGFVPGSVHVPFGAVFFEEWVTALFEKDEPVWLVAEPATVEAVQKSMAALGYDVQGYLDGGIPSWKNSGEAVDLIIDVEPDELMMDLAFDENLIVMDVRNPIEYAEGHLKTAVNLPLQDLTDATKLAVIEDSYNLYLHCGNGIRSVIAASFLKKHGFHNLRIVSGGWEKIQQEPRAAITKEPRILN